MQKLSAVAKKTGSNDVGSSTYRIPNAGSTTNLGAPINYIEQNEFVISLIKRRFERGDPASFSEVTALRIEFSSSHKYSDFQKVVKKGPQLTCLAPTFVGTNMILGAAWNDFSESPHRLEQHRKTDFLPYSSGCYTFTS